MKQTTLLKKHIVELTYEIDHLNSPKLLRKLNMNNFKKISPGSYSFTENFYKTFEELTAILHTLLQKMNRRKHFTIHVYDLKARQRESNNKKQKQKKPTHQNPS